MAGWCSTSDRLLRCQRGWRSRQLLANRSHDELMQALAQRAMPRFLTAAAGRPVCDRRKDPERKCRGAPKYEEQCVRRQTNPASR